MLRLTKQGFTKDCMSHEMSCIMHHSQVGSWTQFAHAAITTCHEYSMQWREVSWTVTLSHSQVVCVSYKFLMQLTFHYTPTLTHTQSHTHTHTCTQLHTHMHTHTHMCTHTHNCTHVTLGNWFRVILFPILCSCVHPHSLVPRLLQAFQCYMGEPGRRNHVSAIT